MVVIHLEPATVIADRYVLERPLRSGDIGPVWLARHHELDLDMALLFVAPDLVASKEAQAALDTQIKALAHLKSPHLFEIHDYGHEQGMPYVVFELCAGETLRRRLERQGRPPLAEAVLVVLHAARALEALHEAGLVHRKLEPECLFLAHEGEEEVLKLASFGLGRALEVDEHETPALPRYTSPEEVAQSEPVDHRADLWSLGVIAYELITGATPFPSEVEEVVLAQIATAAIPPPSELVPQKGLEVDAFFARALERDPQKRFANAMEMARAFAEIAGFTLEQKGAFQVLVRKEEPRASAPPAPVSTPRPSLGPDLAPELLAAPLAGSPWSRLSDAGRARPLSERAHVFAANHRSVLRGVSVATALGGFILAIAVTILVLSRIQRAKELARAEEKAVSPIVSDPGLLYEMPLLPIPLPSTVGPGASDEDAHAGSRVESAEEKSTKREGDAGASDAGENDGGEVAAPAPSPQKPPSSIFGF